VGKFRDFFLGPKVEERAMTWWARDWESPFGPTAGQPVTRTSILGLSAAWSAIGLLSDSISTLPVVAFIEKGDTRIPFELPPRWIEEPGEGLSRIDVLNQTMLSLLIEGEAFLLTPRNEGEIQGIVVVDPMTVTITPDGIYRVLGEEVAQGLELTHIRGLMLPTTYANERRGLGVISYAREGLSAGLATQKFGEAFFGNGAWVGATVEVPGVLSTDGQEAIKAYINERHRGAARAHKIGVLTEGAKLSRPLTFSAEDSQFLQTREFQVADIARFFRVPPEMIGGSTSSTTLTYSTLEGRSAHFVKFSCLPWIVRIENAFTRLWHSEGGPPEGVIKLKVDGLLRGSTKERYDSYKLGLEAGFLTPNEVRALEDMPPIEGGDKPNTAKSAPTKDNEGDLPKVPEE